MPVTGLAGWLNAYTAEAATSQPHCLLGAYAAHLCLMEACRAMLNQPLRSSWVAGAENPHACLIGKFFDEQEWHDTDLGLSHKHLHTILPFYHEKTNTWDEAAEDFRAHLDNAIQQDIISPKKAKHAISTMNGCICSR